MTDIEPAIRKALATHGTGLVNLRRRKRDEAAADIAADIAAAHEAAVSARLGHFTEQDRQHEREMLAARKRVRELEAERAEHDASSLFMAGELERAQDLAAELRKHVDGRDKTIARLREQLAAREAGRPPFHADPGSGLICSACGTEACADGVLMCDEAKTASFIYRNAKPAPGSPPASGPPLTAMPPGPAAAQTPAPGARSAPRARRASRTGPGKGAEAAEAPGAAEGGSEGEGFSA